MNKAYVDVASSDSPRSQKSIVTQRGLTSYPINSKYSDWTDTIVQDSLNAIPENDYDFGYDY